jgi:glycerol kinase
MQFQADILEGTIYRPKISETTALGAASLAGLATGFWRGKEEFRAKWKCGMTFVPSMENAHRQTLIEGWHKAVGRSRNWSCS